MDTKKTGLDIIKSLPAMHNETEILYYELLQGTRVPVTPFEKEVAKQIQAGLDDPNILIMEIPHDI